MLQVFLSPVSNLQIGLARQSANCRALGLVKTGQRALVTSQHECWHANVFFRADKLERLPMPLVEGLPHEAGPLHEELERRVKAHTGNTDMWGYNGGTIVALFASGTAGVVATLSPVTASILSALAAFAIAVTRTLDFGSRWRWHLRRRARYAGMIYRLNSSSLQSPDEQRSMIRALYVELALEREGDGLVPGTAAPDGARDEQPAPA
jgi:hypothetical protein